MTRSSRPYADGAEIARTFEGFSVEEPQEEWRQISWTPNYAVSSFGRVMRVTGGKGCRAGRILRHGTTTTGYPKVELCTEGIYRSCKVHTLVCVAFHGDKPTPLHQVAHNDGNRMNAAASNLRWATQKENEADKILHGRAPRGERHGNSKYTPEIIRAVREAVGTQEEIGFRFGISRRYIGYIRSRGRWGHLDDDNG